MFYVLRMLERRCGTMPYIAPEVLTKPQYSAEPSDIWSCGMVLVAMLTGELPWDKATSDQAEYTSWKDGTYNIDPWKKVDNLPLSLLRKVLMPHPSKRYKMDQIKNHIWVKKKFTGSEGLVRADSKRLCVGGGAGTDRMSLSQPLPADSDREANAGEGDHEAEQPEMFHAFTQPAQLDDMLVSTQGASQSSQTPLQRLVKRMTRFLVNTDLETTEKELRTRLSAMNYGCKVLTPGIVTISCMDRRRNKLVLKASLIEINKQVLMDFRLSRGDGIEFKRVFTKIREVMKEFIQKGPITWSLAMHSQSLPGVTNS